MNQSLKKFNSCKPWVETSNTSKDLGILTISIRIWAVITVIILFKNILIVMKDA